MLKNKMEIVTGQTEDTSTTGENLPQITPEETTLLEVQSLYPGLSPDDALDKALQDDIVTFEEFNKVRWAQSRKKDAIRNAKFDEIEKVAQERERQRVAYVAENLPEALSTFDGILAQAPEPISGTLSEELSNWEERIGYYTKALAAIKSKYGDTAYHGDNPRNGVIQNIMAHVLKERPRPEKPRGDNGGEPGPGGDFMR